MQAPVPIFWATHAGSTHFEVLSNGGAYAGPLTAWFRYKLMGDPAAKDWFEKPPCTLCSCDRMDGADQQHVAVNHGGHFVPATPLAAPAEPLAPASPTLKVEAPRTVTDSAAARVVAARPAARAAATRAALAALPVLRPGGASGRRQRREDARGAGRAARVALERAPRLARGGRSGRPGGGGAAVAAHTARSAGAAVARCEYGVDAGHQRVPDVEGDAATPAPAAGPALATRAAASALPLRAADHRALGRERAVDGVEALPATASARARAAGRAGWAGHSGATQGSRPGREAAAAELPSRRGGACVALRPAVARHRAPGALGRGCRAARGSADAVAAGGHVDDDLVEGQRGRGTARHDAVEGLRRRPGRGRGLALNREKAKRGRPVQRVAVIVTFCPAGAWTTDAPPASRSQRGLHVNPSMPQAPSIDRPPASETDSTYVPDAAYTIDLPRVLACVSPICSERQGSCRVPQARSSAPPGATNTPLTSSTTRAPQLEAVTPESGSAPSGVGLRTPPSFIAESESLGRRFDAADGGVLGTAPRIVDPGNRGAGGDTQGRGRDPQRADREPRACSRHGHRS